ncbi:MAG: hypothetical protein V4537_04495 [Pseudomonadota bacterium]
MKIGFLFNHDALHQISHTAPVIAALAQDRSAEVTVLTSSAAQEARVRDLIGDAATRVAFVTLGVGRTARLLDAALRWIAPFRRVAVLRENLAAFAALDVLVVPETTSLLLRDRFGLGDLKFVWIPHGAGDRSVGFREVMRGFDLVLLSGRKVRDRMLAAGLVTADSHAIVGYPKFDTVDPAAHAPRLFAGDRPTILYNPHFDPKLSSWYPWGEAVVDAIAGRPDVDLVVAPHVMLFQRRIHASVEHRIVRRRRALPPRWTGRQGLIVDPGSTRSIDMSYTRAADIYIGDASSQIYEWIARPRPAIFLNPHRIDWRGDPDFAHWRLGDVVEDLADLSPAIDRALADPHRFDAVQAAAFAETFDRSETPAAARAAAAILARYGAR